MTTSAAASHARLFPLLALVLLACAPTLAACETDSTGSPMAQAAPAPPAKPLTHQEAALQCWMSVEKGRADAPLDKRADIVTKCIKDKMNTGHAPPKAAAAAAADKPAEKPKSPPKPAT